MLTARTALRDCGFAMLVWCVIGAGLSATCVSADDPSSDQEGWIDLLPHVDPAQDALAGEWSLTEEGLVTSAAANSRLVLPAAPTGEYDFRATFTRRTGVHSVALMFVAGEGQATYEVDAWGQHLAGIQQINERPLSENATRTANQTLQNGRRYTMEVRVRRGEVTVLLDDAVLATHRSNGGDLSLLPLWDLENDKRLGIGAYQTETVFHSVEFRSRSEQTDALIARNATPSAPRPTPSPAATGAAQRVLIVVANQDFFYREYADPRQELEQAGITVEVAAARKAACQPHPGSGEGSDGGVIQADIALADVDPGRYAAIIFAGGWGASQYQYAFTGRYDNPAYNGDRAIRDAANRLINEFAAQDKYICGICHGVSVLAWARVDGKSLLDGRNVTAASREAPAGVYNGRRGQPQSRWNAETNQARVAAPNSIGDRTTSRDDVVVDGRIMTAQDDQSARAAGRTLVRLLGGE